MHPNGDDDGSELGRWSWLQRPGLYVGVLVGAVAIGVALLPSSFGWWNFWLSPEVRSELASALIGGAVIGAAVLGAEQAFARRLQSIEADRAARADSVERDRRTQAEREALRLQLGLGTAFPGIDLRGKDLSEFYLSEKTLHSARFANADLTRVRPRQPLHGTP